MALGYPMTVDLNKSKEVCGFGPHEQCAIGLFKVSKAKHVLKFIKKRVGTHMNTKRKWGELSDVLVAMRKARAKKN
ncbi:hypothetical protein A6R68_09200 [Neotoma lepida]|uniref:Large ribosomal subunit protein eL36 n=1 Tax=Neotoma lepida TaxID=56216 RepID=A0A1A6G0H4_NEOLE|nr:hypothetical protein A6R68_09200 [Neotoma lepida]